MIYNLMVADTSPAMKKLYQSVFSEESFRLQLLNSLEELNQALDNRVPEVIIINACLLESVDSIFQFNNKLAELGRVPVFLISGTFEPLSPGYLELLKPDKVFIRPFFSEILVEAVKEAVERRRIPDTLPEELPENLAEDNLQSGQLNPSLLREVRLLIQQEVLDSERELEKRLRSSLFHELKGNRMTEETGADSHQQKTDELRRKG